MRLMLFAVFILFSSCIQAAANDGCIKDSCHEDKLQNKWVHGPVAVQECRYCHVDAGGGFHKWKLAASGAELCAICHDFKKKVNCISCHDPHGSKKEFQLKAGITGKCKK